MSDHIKTLREIQEHAFYPHWVDIVAVDEAINAAIAALSQPVAEAVEVERLRGALRDLLSWFPDAPAPSEWRLRAGELGADDAIKEARDLLAASETEGKG